jgi:hypothetical protein
LAARTVADSTASNDADEATTSPDFAGSGFQFELHFSLHLLSQLTLLSLCATARVVFGTTLLGTAAAAAADVAECVRAVLWEAI